MGLVRRAAAELNQKYNPSRHGVRRHGPSPPAGERSQIRAAGAQLIISMAQHKWRCGWAAPCCVTYAWLCLFGSSETAEHMGHGLLQTKQHSIICVRALALQSSALYPFKLAVGSRLGNIRTGVGHQREQRGFDLHCVRCVRRTKRRTPPPSPSPMTTPTRCATSS
jgi:hypothetical protein